MSANGTRAHGRPPATAQHDHPRRPADTRPAPPDLPARAQHAPDAHHDPAMQGILGVHPAAPVIPRNHPKYLQCKYYKY